MVEDVKGGCGKEDVDQISNRQDQSRPVKKRRRFDVVWTSS